MANFSRTAAFLNAMERSEETKRGGLPWGCWVGAIRSAKWNLSLRVRLGSEKGRDPGSAPRGRIVGMVVRTVGDPWGTGSLTALNTY